MFKILIVVDNEASIPPEGKSGFIRFEEYLRDYPKLSEPKTRVVNLCDTESYLSKGYYCSLLAEARKHVVLPSVKTINELRSGARVVDSLGRLADIPELDHQQGEFSFLICLGKTIDPAFQKLGSWLFKKFPAPLLRITYLVENQQARVERGSYSTLTVEERTSFDDILLNDATSPWKKSASDKHYRWDMAILVNPEEAVPPSDRGAISRFIKAAAKQGIRATTVSNDALLDINHYDALFIRETTAIDHHTYRLAREAESKGIVVLDDPDSILRCCNKVFLHDAFNYQKVPSPATEFVDRCSDDVLDMLSTRFGFPMVLKMPEGSFSQGVFKVNDLVSLKAKLAELFELSALVLVQEYLFTEFDWRVGVLNGRAIYACKYFMARNHWQIYNHGSKRYFSGGFESFPTFEVPKVVLDAALKAAKVVGNGLYGVDIKVVDHHAYVLEVNDNPSIDHKVEDGYLGDELYMQIMAEFLRRLELRGR
jgi:glutathione synthase/RimK-type ligase-like ATP-grasp enzyme